MSTKTRSSSPWILGAAVLVVVIFAAAWFLAISPRVEAAAQTRADTETQEHQNQVIQTRINRLTAQAETLDDVKAELATLREGIPVTTQWPEFTAAVTELTHKNKIYIGDIEAGMPEPMRGEAVEGAANTPVAKPAESGEDDEAADDEAADDEAAEGEEAGETAPVAEVLPDGTLPPVEVPDVPDFYGIPVTVTAYGNDKEINATIADLQEMDRLFLVTQVSIIAQVTKPASGGLPPMEPGDAELKVTGYVYVLLDPMAEPRTDGDSLDAPTFPRDTDGRNVIEPLGRQGWDGPMVSDRTNPFRGSGSGGASDD